MPSKKVEPEINAPNAPILFVARDPGLQELNNGRPLVGKSGVQFNDALTAAGIRRQDINITNRVLHKPWKNDFQKHGQAEIAQGRKELFELIHKHKPKLVVTMGNEATYDLVDEFKAQAGSTIKKASGINNYRGFFFWNKTLNCWVLPTLHPASTLYQPSNTFVYYKDIERAAAWLRGDLPRETPPSARPVQGPLDLASMEGLTAFDIETNWGMTRLRVTCFCPDDLQPRYLWGHESGLMRSWLQSDAPKLACNGKFDSYFLQYKEGLNVNNLTEDVMALWWAINPELAGQEDHEEYASHRITRKSLSFLASIYLNCPWWKSYENDDQKMMELCAQDVWVTRKLYDLLYEEAQKLGVLPQYRQNMAMQPSLIKILNRGLLVDEDLRRSRIAQLRKRQAKAEKATEAAALEYIRSNNLKFFLQTKQCQCCNGRGHGCWSCAGLPEMPKRKSDWLHIYSKEHLDAHTVSELKDSLPPCETCKGAGQKEWFEFNLRSPVQVEELLFRELSVPSSLKVNGSSASQDTLRRVYEWSLEPAVRGGTAARRSTVEAILRDYFTAKKDGTQEGIYKRLKPAPDGRIRTDLTSYKVVTGRLSSSDTALEPHSTNLQNLPKNTAMEDELYQVREVIIPDPGCVLLCADLAKAEAVVAAADMEDWDFYEALLRGEDVHSEHAREYMGSVTEINRQICKEITFGGNYLASSRTMAQRINRNAWKTGVKLSVSEVQDLMDQHFEKHGQRLWWERIWKEAEATNFWLENPLGLRRQFKHPDDHKRHKLMTNWRCQSTVACVINNAWLEIWNTLDMPGLASLMMQVHDEIVLQVEASKVEEVSGSVKEALQQPFELHGREVYIPAELKVHHHNWHKGEKLDV